MTEANNSGEKPDWREAIVAELGEGAGEEAILTARVGQLEGRCDRLVGELAAMTAERDAMTAERDKLAAASAKAKAEVKALRVLAPKARRIGRRKEDADAAKLPPVPRDDNARALLELVREAGSAEVVFSDGKGELPGVPALQVSGAAWRVTVNGLQLEAGDVLVAAPGPGALELAGYALLIDGEQVAWRERGDKLRLVPGQTMNLAGDVIF